MNVQFIYQSWITQSCPGLFHLWLMWEWYGQFCVMACRLGLSCAWLAGARTQCHAHVRTWLLEKTRLASGQGGARAGEGSNYLQPSRQTSPGTLHTGIWHCRPAGWPFWTTGLWATRDCVFDGCTELQNFSWEGTLPNSSGNDGYLNTDIPVTDGNRPKKDNFNINQEWNPWLLEYRVGFFSTVLSANYPIWYSQNHFLQVFLQVQILPFNFLGITEKKIITCSKPLSQLVVSLLFTRGKNSTDYVNGFFSLFLAPRTISLLCNCMYKTWEPKIKVSVLSMLMAEFFCIFLGQFLEKGLFPCYK